MRIMVVLFCAMVFSSSAWAQNPIVKIVSTDIPGFVSEEGGSFIDLFRQAGENTGFDVELTLMPWQRAVRRVEKSEDQMIIPFSRTPEREDRFTWVVMFNEVHNGFVTVGEAVDSMEAAKALDTVIVWKGSSQQAYLEQAGFENLYPVSSADTILSLLKTGRAAAWYGVLAEARSTIAQSSEYDDLTMGAVVDSEQVWLAGPASLDPAPYGAFAEEVERLRDAAAAAAQ